MFDKNPYFEIERDIQYEGGSSTTFKITHEDGLTSLTINLGLSEHTVYFKSRNEVDLLSSMLERLIEFQKKNLSNGSEYG